jgi:hypothetical protein
MDPADANKSKRRGNHFIAGADAERQQRQNQRICPRRASNGVFAAGELSDIFLKRIDFRSQNKLLAIEAFA